MWYTFLAIDAWNIKHLFEFAKISSTFFFFLDFNNLHNLFSALLRDIPLEVALLLAAFVPFFNWMEKKKDFSTSDSYADYICWSSSQYEEVCMEMNETNGTENRELPWRKWERRRRKKSIGKSKKRRRRLNSKSHRTILTENQYTIGITRESDE